MVEELILKLVQIQTQFRFLHWQTMFDAKHRAYDNIYNTFNDFLDPFAEAMMGKYGRPKFEPEFAVMFQDISSLDLQAFIDAVTEFLVGMTDKLDPKYDTDLLNIRDEILMKINRLKYLLTLKH